MQRLFALFFLALTTLQAQLPTPYILEDTTYSKFQSPYCVNIGSGGFFCEEVDAIVDGPVPLVIRRFYNSLQENDHPVYGHWIFLPDSHLDQNTKDRTASVSDSCGMTLHYGCGHEGKYYVDAKDRNYIYNDSSGILSAKTFPINNFMEPHPELNEMHVFTCDGIKKIYKLNSSHKKESHYLLSESILTNGYRVFYTYDSENRVSQISNAYPSSKIFSWAKFTYAEDKLNYWIDLSDGRHLTYYNQTADEPNQYLLKHVDRTEGPIVNYEYMPKNPNGKPNIQEQSYNFYVHKRLKKIAYPDGRSLYNDYYTRSDFKERTVEHPCSGKIRSQQKPLNSDGSLVPVISYEYKHNHSKKNYYDIENMQVLTKDSNGLSTTYHLYKTHKPLAVELFDDHRKICRTEHIIYQEGHCSGNCTIGRFINDSKNTPIASKRWVSDPKGNVLQERNYGNITGTCAYEKISNEYSPPSSFVPPWQKEPLTLRNFSSLLKQYVGAIRFESQTITGGDCSIRNFSYSNDRFNNLLSETDEKGLTTHYTYIPDTILIKSIVVEACNVTYSKTVNDYDEENRLISTLITDGTDNSPQSLITKYEYANDRLITIAEGYLDTNKSYCQLKRISHEYDQYGHVTKEYHFDANNELNYTIHKAYNDHGLLVSETDPLGRSQHYSYDNNGNKTYIQGVNPEVCTHYSYDLCNRLVSEEEVHADGVVLTSHYSYDFLDHLIKKVDPYGAETLYEYDSLGNQVKIIHPFVADTQGGVYRPMIEKRYDDLGHVIWEKDPNGTETHIKTTIKGKPYETTINGHQTTSCTYTLSGQIATSTSPNGDKTIFTYDALDREIKKEVYGANGEFLGLITSTYDAFHILSKTNEEGVTTTYSYDLAGRLIAEQVGDHKTTYHYDSLGNKDKTLNWIDDNNFIASHVTHDLAGRVVQETVVDTHGNLLKKVNYEYDIAGNRTTVIVDCSDGLLDISKKIYNSRKQIIESIDALNRSTTYQYELVNHCNVNGIKTSEVDPMGLKTVFIKDNLGRLNHISKYNKDGLPIFLEEKRYDGNNNLILQDDYVRQNGVALRTQRSSWIYGPKNRLEKQILATGTIDEQITEHLYDDKGRLSTTIKADGVRVNFEYDGKGRLKRRHSFGNETIRPIDDVFEYNLCDNIVRVIDNITGHVSLRNYDTYQNVIAETLNNQTLNFSYDNLNRQIGLTLPDQSSVNYIYGALHLNAIQRLDVNQHIQYTHDYLERDLRGNVLKSQGLEGVQEYTYDILGRYSSITSEFFAENDYLYDDVDNLHSLTSKDIRGTRQHTFSYDELYQLTSENGEGYHTYSNDSLSNRVEYDNNICTINFLNQHLLDHQGPCHYNKAGNLTNRNNCKFTYDALDRLVSSLINEETRADYTYDSWHRRLTKSVYKLVDGSWTLYSSLNYLYEGQNEIGAMDDHGQIVEFRVLGEGLGAEIGSAISIKLDGKIYGVIHDQRGCVRALVQDGQLVEGYAYTAYGIEKIFNGSNQVLQHSEIDNPWRFSSKRTDSETGLVYFGRRFYIPELGRWMTQDPEGYRDGPNLYAYVHNDPFNSIDLYGLQTMPMPAFEPVRFTGFDYISAIGFCAVQGVLYPQDVICQDWKDAKKLLHPLLLLQTIKNTPNDQLAMMITERMGSKLGLTLSALLLAVSCGDSAPLTTACGKVINKAVPGITRVFVRGAVQQSVQRAGTEVCQRVVVRQEFLKSIGNRVDQLKYECLNNMSKSGKSLDRGGLTRAGRALDKHGNRPGSPFPKAVGNHISKNKQGQFHLDDILTNPNSNIELIDLCNYRTFVPDGRGAYFYSDGTLRGFLKNPNWQKP